MEDYSEEAKNTIALLKTLSDEDRAKVVSHFCPECGWFDKVENTCQCWNND